MTFHKKCNWTSGARARSPDDDKIFRLRMLNIFMDIECVVAA